ncbi:Uu.00g111980.m01.CDS01 [Anthostomella pinea]|uniref:Uu.00g111980.m01.CDS01 n=1 Tax=Anthostomella pinea TaxID=933095 RepID=A0AAI8VG58_9PEZI|nr:Uu.00g111980.m01.CDS01 [Anthostomella pinea]
MPPKRGRKTPAVPVRGGWDVLPHNMGTVPASTGVRTPASKETRTETRAEVAEEDQMEPVIDATVHQGRQLRPRKAGVATESVIAVAPADGEGPKETQTETPAKAIEEDKEKSVIDDSIHHGRQLRPRKARDVAESTFTANPAAIERGTKKRKRRTVIPWVESDDEGERADQVPKPKAQRRKPTKKPDIDQDIKDGDAEQIAEPKKRKRQTAKKSDIVDIDQVFEDDDVDQAAEPKKQKRQAAKKPDIDELFHDFEYNNAEQAANPKKRKRQAAKKFDIDNVDQDLEDNDFEQAAKPKKRKHKATKKSDIDQDFKDDDDEQVTKAKKKPAKKANPYGLMPGQTPFPDHEAPTAEQCEEVYRLLATLHDDVQPQAPEVIPAPSLEVTGCGEVPFVLDALIRTLLSGATTFANAAKMLTGLIEKYGVLEEGPGKGSIHWNKVRLSPMEEVAAAIRAGGLATIKAKSIKAILDMVHQENAERRAAYIAEKETGQQANILGAPEKTDGQKELEILKAEQDILSLDHLRGLSADEAMQEFIKYPGVGVKTAACVILFCLQMPCFAVDTHVHKFSHWLGWAPEKSTENQVFMHLEVRCPEKLKYGLHQLFIRHGQTCGKCKRATAEGTEEWKAIECPLEHLLDRFDKRQTKALPKPKKRVKTEDEDVDVKEEEAKEEEEVKEEEVKEEEEVTKEEKEEEEVTKEEKEEEDAQMEAGAQASASLLLVASSSAHSE